MAGNQSEGGGVYSRMRMLRTATMLSLVLVLRAQESGGVSFDPPEVGPDWTKLLGWESLIAVSVGGAMIVFVRAWLLPVIRSWLLSSRAQFAFPWAMVSASWLLILVGLHLPHEQILDTIASILVVLLVAANLPFILFCSMILAINETLGPLNGLVLAIGATVAFWLYWYGIVRYSQYRLKLNRDLSFHLNDLK